MKEDFYMLSIKNNIKPIIGLELNIENEKLVLYCMNFNGYQNLLKINNPLFSKKFFYVSPCESIGFYKVFKMHMMRAFKTHQCAVYTLINISICNFAL